MKSRNPIALSLIATALLFAFQNCGETSFQKQSESRLESTGQIAPPEPIVETVIETVEVQVKTGVGCAPGFTEDHGKWGVPCEGDYTCWKKKEDAEKYGGAPVGSADGSLYGWPKWYVQCEMQYEQLPAICQEGSFAWKGRYKTPCESKFTCWRKKSDGFVEGLADGTQYGWDDYYVQCQKDTPQI